jgi:hypothetical protein
MKNKMFVVSAGVLALTGLSANATITLGPITTAPDGSGGTLWTYPIIFVNTTISSTQPTSFSLNDFGVLKTTDSMPTGFTFSPGVAFTLDNSQSVGPSFGLPGFQPNNPAVNDVVITFTANADMGAGAHTFNLVLDTELTGTGGRANFFSQDIVSTGDLAGSPNAVQQNISTPAGSAPPITLTRGIQFLDDPMTAGNGSLTDICGVPVGRNRWFLVRPTTTGMAIFSSKGSQIDTVMGVYRNDIFNNVLVCPDCWNDNQSASSTFSEVRVPVQTGTLYRICLAGKNGAVGDLHLNYCVLSELKINPLPNAQVQLSWPSEANGFVLQTTKTPSVANSWSTLAGVPTVVNNVITLSVNASDSAFYRLYHSLP